MLATTGGPNCRAPAEPKKSGANVQIGCLAFDKTSLRQAISRALSFGKGETSLIPDKQIDFCISSP